MIYFSETISIKFLLGVQSNSYWEILVPNSGKNADSLDLESKSRLQDSKSRRSYDCLRGVARSDLSSIYDMVVLKMPVECQK